MQVLVIGATGAVGLPLVSQLVERGHEVVGTSRSGERAETLRELGAEPALLDVLDRNAVRRMVLETRPDAIVHQATSLAGGFDFKRFAETFAQTNRLRTEGADNLLSAAKEAGIERFVAQSYGGGVTYARVGGRVKTEDDPLDESLPDTVETVEAIKHLETAVLDAGGIALRYGSSTAPRSTRCATPCAGGRCRSSETGTACGRSSTSPTRRQRPCSRSSEASPVSTTSRTTIRHRRARCSTPWQRHSVLRLRGRCRPGSRSCSRESSASS